ncbi:thioredoxin family protein [Halapricum hydrolyticum]|uniref:Thioredoxin family protein n=1 Tax=Halapricum hydrolyticum TaxID=2979991 RepID=A0AAE3LGD0_9EURY|nr:thioredoxin family protein [Halapricum hydrolyticum]MCU4719263.1 thioredoxin family protein [Halapricum hydrolyticum]MCU4728552.1 thioredoxin family protein [Halapricum hydrolyticum]
MSVTFDAEQPPDRPIDLADSEALMEFVETYEDVLVEFYTDGCGVCASMEPVLSGVARAGVVVGTINPRDDPPLVDEYEIASVPTFVRFRDGEPIDRLAEGFVPGEQLQAFAQG